MKIKKGKGRMCQKGVFEKLVTAGTDSMSHRTTMLQCMYVSQLKISSEDQQSSKCFNNEYIYQHKTLCVYHVH